LSSASPFSSASTSWLAPHDSDVFVKVHDVDEVYVRDTAASAVLAN
jgi:hypothetical protein